MARTRKDNPLNLPPRVYFDHGQFFYVHRNGKWEPLGTDVATAIRKGKHYGEPGATYGTVSFWLDAFIIACEKRVGLKGKNGLAPRTVSDYTGYAVPLKTFFGAMLPTEVAAMHVGEYLDIGAENDRPVRANREKACLSAFYTWMMRKGHAGVAMNPCIGVKRNPEDANAVYVEDADYLAVRNKTPSKNLLALSGLVYRTLQRPSDVLSWTRANIKPKVMKDGTTIRILKFTQGKTKREMEIEITAEIDAELAYVNTEAIGVPLIRSSQGKTKDDGTRNLNYTEEGIASMWRYYCGTAKVKSFGIMHLRGKGATDMYLSGVPLEQIQALMGHDSVTTTEIYIKRRMKFVAKPNQVKVAG